MSCTTAYRAVPSSRAAGRGCPFRASCSESVKGRGRRAGLPAAPRAAPLPRAAGGGCPRGVQWSPLSATQKKRGRGAELPARRARREARQCGGGGACGASVGPQHACKASAAPASRGARVPVSRSLLCGRGCAAYPLVRRPVQRPVLLGAVPHGAARGTKFLLLHGRLPLVARGQGAVLQAVLRDVRAPPCLVILDPVLDFL